jgi:hypothetical protein
VTPTTQPAEQQTVLRNGLHGLHLMRRTDNTGITELIYVTLWLHITTFISPETDLVQKSPQDLIVEVKVNKE